MNLESFCRNLRGLNNKADFDLAYLESIFENIHKHEIKDSSTLQSRFEESLKLEPFGMLESFVPDTEAMIYDVYDVLLDGLLSSRDSRALNALSLLAQIHNNCDILITRLAKINKLIPVPLVTLSTDSPDSSTTSALPSAALRNPIASGHPFVQPSKPKLNHSHLILLFSTLYHQSKATTISESTIQLTIEIFSTLFVHNYLPSDLCEYEDKLRNRPTRIPLALDGYSVNPSTSQSVNPTPTVAPASTRPSSPNNGNQQNPSAPRAGSSLFSFISYISTSFSTPEPQNEESRLIKEILQRCHLNDILHTLISLSALANACHRIPALVPFYLDCMAQKLLCKPDLQPQELSIFRKFLVEHFNQFAGHAVSLALHTVPRIPSLLDDAELIKLTALHIPNFPEILVTLSNTEFAMLARALTPLQFMEVVKRSKTLDGLARTLQAHSLLPNGLDKDEYKGLATSIYRAIVRSSNSTHVHSVAEASFALLPQIVSSFDGYIEFIKIFAILLFHSAPAVRSYGLPMIERVLFFQHGPEDSKTLAATFSLVLIPMMQQLMVERQRVDDQVKLAALITKYYVQVLPILGKSCNHVWDLVLGVLLEYIKCSSHMVRFVSF